MSYEVKLIFGKLIITPQFILLLVAAKIAPSSIPAWQRV
jgi:hypothetical protein